jgi:uncharacterized protein YjiS (DUF1127 family)
MWTVIVSPSAETVARVTPPPSCCPQPRAPARRARSAAAGPRRRASVHRPARLPDDDDGVANYREYLATYEELNALTDRELADLGLSRLNVREVAREAIYGN